MLGGTSRKFSWKNENRFQRRTSYECRTLGREVGSPGLSAEGTGTGKECQRRHKRKRMRWQDRRGRREQEEMKLKS